MDQPPPPADSPFLSASTDELFGELCRRSTQLFLIRLFTDEQGTHVRTNFMPLDSGAPITKDHALRFMAGVSHQVQECIRTIASGPDVISIGTLPQEPNRE